VIRGALLAAIAGLVGTVLAQAPHRGCAAGGTAGSAGDGGAEVVATSAGSGAAAGGAGGQDDPYAGADEGEPVPARDGGADPQTDGGERGAGGAAADGGPSRGGAPSTGDDEDRTRTAKERAQRLMSEGVRLLRRAAYAPALVKFRQAHRRYPSPKLLLNMGTTLRLLGRNAEALEAYGRYRAGKEVDPARLAELEPVVEELYRRVAGVTVFIDDDDAIARLDGRPLASLDGSRWIWLEPGEHVLLVESPGHPSKVQVLRMSAGDRRNLVIELERELAPVRPATPSLRTTGTVLGAIGIGGLAVAAALGITAVVLDQAAAEHCRADAPSRCDSTGASLGAHAGGLEAATLATLATAATIGGIGLTLYLVSPASDPTAAAAAPVKAELGPTGIVVHGRFRGL